MRFNTVLPIVAITPASINAFHVGTTSNPAAVTTTSLEARRLMVPMLRRRRASSMFFPDVDRMFREMDEMMENTFSELSRPSSMLATYPQAQGMGLRQPLGFEVTQDEKEFKVTMNIADVEVKDIDLQLDPDGRVLRLKGNKVQEESGMKIQSSFEKALLLHPDVDTDKISATFDGGVLSIVAPKIVKEEVVEEKKSKKIDITVADSSADELKAVADTLDEANDEKTPSVTSRLDEETMDNKATADKDIPEKKWPVRDFPY